jgi:hypothetical protein
MGINLKDLLLTYIIGIMAYIMIGAVSIAIDGYQLWGLPIVLSLLLVPGLLYFYRNSSDTKEALGVSALFGFTFWPFLTILEVIFTQISMQSSGAYAPGYAFLMPPLIPLLLVWLIIGSLLTAVTFISYLVVKYIVRKSPK